ncbi:MAG TPA: hypothetical protein VKI44_09540 [Acetobacteraceae bacterium]|nr:hypothetical protein [Acetobacteraceae bacterium]
MSAAAEAPAPPAEPSRSGRLLALVRKLIGYGRDLVTTVSGRIAVDPSFAKSCFGTADLTLILARIARGLQLANALETRVLRSAARIDAGPVRGRAQPAAARAPAAPRVAETDPGLAGLPSAAQLAAELRRRSIGDVIGDICRDLGIRPSHPLWREVHLAMTRHGGNFVRLVTDILDRAFPLAARLLSAATSAASRPPALRFAAPGGTGPPAEPAT